MVTRPNPNNVSATTLFGFLVRDFEVAWDLMCEDDRPDTREVGGNFMFARQAMTLLELTCRVARQGGGLGGFSSRLHKIDRRYFTPLPAGRPQSEKEFELPRIASQGPSHKQLIAVLFDLIRNGQAHQAQQIFATLSDGRTLGISLCGAEGGRTLAVLNSEQGRPATHLSFGIKPKTGNVWLNICPGTLFLDLHHAARASIFSGGIDPEYLDRRFETSAGDFTRALREGAITRLSDES